MIRRLSSTYGAPHMDSTDIFFVDGQELMPCAKAPDSPGCAMGGATHTFRVETYQRVVLDGNEWTITSRDGTQYRYVPKLGDPSAADRTYSWGPVSYTHLRAHETPEHLVCRLLLEKKKITA